MWSIQCLKNNVVIPKECADELFAAQAYEAEIWYNRDEVTYEDKLYFNPDHYEHMDFVEWERNQNILKKHKVKGDICFCDVEGDDKGSFWGYRFDGKGGMKELTGSIVWKASD